ncbi:MAG TPA: M3 family oligoendopeptidase [Anaerolineae bacterium]
MDNGKYQPTRWTLSELLSSHGGPELEAYLAQFEQQVKDFEEIRPQLRPDINPAEFVEIVQGYETLEAAGRRVGAYAQLWFTEDTQSQAALAFLGRIDQLSAEVANRMLFFSLWWKSLDDETANRLMAASGDYRYWLESLRRFKPHTLSESEEKIVNLKDVNGMNALLTLYDVITNAFTFELEIDGRKKKMTRAELSAYVRHPNPDVRAAVYQEMLGRVFKEHANTLGQIYMYRVRDWFSENIQLRKHASPLAVRNLSNDIPDAATDALLEVCRRNTDLFQRYFRLKARWLDIPSGKLRRYDVYAPIVASDKAYPYSDAVGMVLDSLHHFSSQISEHARRVFADHHIDSEIRPGKQGGAFCASILPGLTPYVLLNYTGRARDVATMAHELGHAIHAMMAAHHSTLTFHSSLPLAETASVFSEMILNDRLLATETDPAVRRDILATQIDDAYATVMRQAYFVLFEREAHERILKGATTDELAEAYLANLREQFGDSLELADEFRWEWVSIPHIYQTPFYCYAYSFGQLLVLSLYRRYKAEGESFKPKYLKILAYGGSESPAKILREAGIDMASPDFWQGGFDVIKEMIDELEKMEAVKA